MVFKWSCSRFSASLIKLESSSLSVMRLCSSAFLSIFLLTDLTSPSNYSLTSAAEAFQLIFASRSLNCSWTYSWSCLSLDRVAQLVNLSERASVVYIVGIFSTLFNNLSKSSLVVSQREQFDNYASCLSKELLRVSILVTLLLNELISSFNLLVSSSAVA